MAERLASLFIAGRKSPPPRNGLTVHVRIPDEAVAREKKIQVLFFFPEICSSLILRINRIVESSTPTSFQPFTHRRTRGGRFILRENLSERPAPSTWERLPLSCGRPADGSLRVLPELPSSCGWPLGRVMWARQCAGGLCGPTTPLGLAYRTCSDSIMTI